MKVKVKFFISCQISYNVHSTLNKVLAFLHNFYFYFWTGLIAINSVLVSMEYSWKSTFDWIYGGVDPKFDGNGGPECVGFLTPGQRLLETIIILSISILEIVVCWPRLKVPAHVINAENTRQPERPGKRFMLVLLSVVFGIELGLKFATKTMIYILNPCHILTAVQVRIFCIN